MKRIILSITMLLTLSGASAARAVEIRIATGHTFIKKVFDPVRCAFKDKTGIDIKIIYDDPVPALAELEKGNVDAAGASLALEEWLMQAKKAGVPVREAGAYTSYIATTEKVMIVVNDGNRVKTLSKEQLKDIFTGRTLNWKEVGGDDAPILAVWPSVSSGALIVFRSKIMDNAPTTKAVYDVESMADTPDAVAATPEAIGVVTASKVPNGTKEVAPAIERPLSLVYKGVPSPNLQKLLDFLKGEGKSYIK
ncbi:MAG: substrate-binding domain-containing protein [Desulfuromonadaceae bacterium]